jgi:hypothetical protein
VSLSVLVRSPATMWGLRRTWRRWLGAGANALIGGNNSVSADVGINLAAGILREYVPFGR